MQGKVLSYHKNTLGETNLIYPGSLESKDHFRMRVSQGIVDIIVHHFYHMQKSEQNEKQILFIVTHHNVIHEFMRIFDRNEKVAKKMLYCWTGAIELEIEDEIQPEQLFYAHEINDVFTKLKVLDFKIVKE